MSRRSAPKELVDLLATCLIETDKAYRLDSGMAVDWVPKSMVEKNDDGTFTMPEWLAHEKGFI